MKRLAIQTTKNIVTRHNWMPSNARLFLAVIPETW